jgi:hypothetical protein
LGLQQQQQAVGCGATAAAHLLHHPHLAPCHAAAAAAPQLQLHCFQSLLLLLLAAARLD